MYFAPQCPGLYTLTSQLSNRRDLLFRQFARQSVHIIKSTADYTTFFSHTDFKRKKLKYIFIHTRKSRKCIFIQKGVSTGRHKSYSRNISLFIVREAEAEKLARWLCLRNEASCRLLRSNCHSFHEHFLSHSSVTKEASLRVGRVRHLINKTWWSGGEGGRDSPSNEQRKIPQ